MGCIGGCMLLAACGDVPTSVTADASASSDAAIVWDTRIVTLTSGLAVEVWGPELELAALPDVPTASELCEGFELSVTVVVNADDGTPTTYSASAGYRAAPRGCQDDADPILCVPHKYFRDHVVPSLDSYEIPREPAQDGYYNHPLGITFFVAEERQNGSPLFTGLFDSRTAAPLAGFLHDDGANEPIRIGLYWRQRAAGA